MDLIYWIISFDSIKTIAAIMSLFFLIASIFFWCAFLDDEKLSVLIISIFSSILFFVNISICAFLPSTKNAFIIYGLNGTIEYIKNNDTAKQLPDKAIKCLDLLLDNYLEKEESSNDSN